MAIPLKFRSELFLAAVVTLVAVIAAIQNAPAQDASAITEAINRIQNDEPDPAPENRLRYVDILAHARAVEAIPVLEDYYERTNDPVIKEGVASALVRLGDKSKIYQNYLAADAIERVRKNNLGVGPVDAMSYVDWIAIAKGTEGISVLEEYYSRTKDPDIKAGVASALVRMGDKNDAYWTYLVALAKQVIQSDAPTPWNLTAGRQGDPISPEFKIWANTHNLPVKKALTMLDELPKCLAPLAWTGDPRGIPLLRKALSSPNLSVSSLAAGGLAQANDTASVPLIIDACKRLPPESAGLLADSLLYFDDPQAQNTYHLYFPETNIPEARAFRGGVFAGIPWHSR